MVAYGKAKSIEGLAYRNRLLRVSGRKGRLPNGRAMVEAARLIQTRCRYSTARISETNPDLGRVGTSLKNCTAGFARVTTHHIIEHLYTNYGHITIKMLTENKTKMKQWRDATTPIELLFEQIDNGQAYTTARGDLTMIPNLSALATTTSKPPNAWK